MQFSQFSIFEFTEDRLKEEHNKWINTSAEGIEFVRKHPEYIEEYEKFTYDPSDEPGDAIEEVYSRVKSGSFGHQVNSDSDLVYFIFSLLE